MTDLFNETALLICQVRLFRSHHASFSYKDISDVKLIFLLNGFLLNRCQKLTGPAFLSYSYSVQRGYLSSSHTAIYHHSVTYTSTVPNHITFRIRDGQKHNNLLTLVDPSLVISMLNMFMQDMKWQKSTAC